MKKASRPNTSMLRRVLRTAALVRAKVLVIAIIAAVGLSLIPVPHTALPAGHQPVEAASEPGPIAGQGYQLVFEDNFNTLDTNVWGKHPWRPNFPAGSVSVTAGILSLKSRQADGYPWIEFTTLGQRTGTFPVRFPNAKSWQEGYFEARIRHTNSPHSWPVFWLMGVERVQRWPDNTCDPHIVQAEWDIMENFKWASPLTGIFHAAMHRNSGGSCNVPHTSQGFTVDNGLDIALWHTYSGKWEGNQLISYVDGQYMGTFTAYDSFDQPLYMILSQHAECLNTASVCSMWPKPPELETQVDWVRAWHK